MEKIGKRDELLSYLLSLPSDEKIYVMQVKEFKPKRSLSANSYCWVLIGKLADMLRESKEQVYLNMLEHYGQSQIISVLSEVDISKFIKYYKKIGTGTINGKEFTHYKVFKGSSEFDTKEMSIFLDGIIYECESIGIETLTPKEIAMLKGDTYEK